MGYRIGVLAVLPGMLLGAGTALHVRSFHLEYDAVVKDVPPGAAYVDVWIPVPHDDSYQQIRHLQIDSPYPYRILTGSQGNEMLHVRVEHPEKPELSIGVHFDATREEHRQPRLYTRAGVFRDESPAVLAQYLKPDRLVPLDDQIRTWARQVVDAANAHTDLEMARAIYNHVVATVKYDKTGKGWGRGDIYYACEARRGNCTDFHAIFIGYCRAVGIPARFAIGLPLPPERGEGKIAGYHCWAEFYAKGIGWVPIDASEAAKNPAKREYFFGTHDENRLEFSKGRDVVLTPRQHGDPLNYFIYPYAEVDGKAVAATASEVSYRDTTAAASLPAKHRLER
jgi:transglutaminase-like putative cysteine protease